MPRTLPEWFTLTEQATPEVMRRVATLVSNIGMSLQVRSLPMLAHWFILDSLFVANKANRDGMHANALALTRQCIEAISVVEVGLSGHSGAEETLLRWERDEIKPGNLRAWLEANVWPQYGSGLWTEPWSTFMGEFSRAIQPYAHYGRSLAQWQMRIHGISDSVEPNASIYAAIELRPRAYDPQKATRITLFHGLLTYTLGRISLAGRKNDPELAALVTRLGVALGKSRYLDGHETNWSQQFWAMLWERGGKTILE